MIVFNLRCAKDHVFEAWFQDGAAYDRQARKGQIACPDCGGRKIEKAPMAPRVSSGRARKISADTAAATARQLLGKLRDEVEKNCDFVGDRFAEEARKIHYEEVEKRNIYGQATDEEARDLREEGVEFGQVPWLPRTDS